MRFLDEEPGDSCLCLLSGCRLTGHGLLDAHPFVSESQEQTLAMTLLPSCSPADNQHQPMVHEKYERLA